MSFSDLVEPHPLLNTTATSRMLVAYSPPTFTVIKAQHKSRAKLKVYSAQLIALICPVGMCVYLSRATVFRSGSYSQSPCFIYLFYFIFFLRGPSNVLVNVEIVTGPAGSKQL